MTNSLYTFAHGEGHFICLFVLREGTFILFKKCAAPCLDTESSLELTITPDKMPSKLKNGTQQLNRKDGKV